MSTMSNTSTNCLTCNEIFIAGTGIFMYKVGDFCSPDCFTMHIGKTKKHITFGPDSVHAPAMESSGIVRPSSQAPLMPKPMHKVPPPVAHPPSGTVRDRAAVIESLLNRAPVRPSAIPTTPVMPAPVTPVPVMPAPVMPAPVTPAPVTPAPVTQGSFYSPYSYYSPTPNTVIVQNFPKDLLPPPVIKISVAPPKPKPQPKYIDHVMGFCTFCETNHVLTCENPSGQKFCEMSLLVRYGDGYAHAMAKINPTYIQGLGTFDSWARYAVPFVYIK